MEVFGGLKGLVLVHEASTRLEARGLGGLGGAIHGGTSPTKVPPPIREEAVPAGLEGVVTAGEEEAVHM